MNIGCFDRALADIASGHPASEQGHGAWRMAPRHTQRFIFSFICLQEWPQNQSLDRPMPQKVAVEAAWICRTDPAPNAWQIARAKDHIGKMAGTPTPRSDDSRCDILRRGGSAERPAAQSPRSSRLDPILLACQKPCCRGRNVINPIRMHCCFDLFCSCLCCSDLRRFVRRRSRAWRA